jgi:nucleotide-binding universal stress UspA family protein
VASRWSPPIPCSWAHLPFSDGRQGRPGGAETIIARTIKEREIDLLLMGVFNHSPLRKLIFGSRTNQRLRSAKVPTLLLR